MADFTPVGGTFETVIAGRKVTLTNPGVRAVLKAQEECLSRTGEVSLVRYVSLVGQRWCNPALDLDDFETEDDVIEFLRVWNEFRRPPTVGEIRADPPVVPVGQAATVTLGPGREIKVVNPGLKWVLRTQEESVLPNGAFSALRFLEAILRDCVVGAPKLDDVFLHEDEVVEFLRIFRLLRSGSRARDTQT